MKTFLLVIVSGLIGVFLSDFLIGMSYRLTGTRDKRCVADNVCVGDKEVRVLLGLFTHDHIGGMDAIFCGKPGRDEDNDFIFLPDLVAGKICEKSRYTYHFRNSTTVTRVEVDEGVIVKISQGPLHQLDF